jgi:hypothetical protein
MRIIRRPPYMIAAAAVGRTIPASPDAGHRFNP